MNGTAQWEEDRTEDFDFLEILFKFLRNWYWFLLTVGISLFVARFYLRGYAPIYRMSATILIKQDGSASNANNIVDQLDLADSKILDNEMAILKSRPLVGKVVDNLGLTVTYWYEGENRDTEIYKDSPVKIEVTEILSGGPFFVRPLPGNQFELLSEEHKKLGVFYYSEKLNSRYGKFRVFKQGEGEVAAGAAPVKVIMQGKESVIAELIGAIQVGLQNPKSTLVSISIENSLQEKGKDILMNLLDEYTFATLADKNMEASNTLRFIEERLKIVSMELGDVEQNVEEFRRTKGIADLGAEANLFLGKVQQNDSKLNEIDINLRVLDGVESYVNSSDVGNIAPATLGVSDGVLNSYINQLSNLEAERLKLSQTVQEGNPYLETLNTQMRNIRQAIQENLKNQRSNLLIAKNSVLSLNDRLEGTISSIPKKEREFVGIKRQAGVKENLYLLLLQKREETALSYASTVTDSRMIEPPFALPGAIKPDKRQIYSYAVLIGLLIPAALIFLRESLRNTVQSKKEIESKTGFKVFGEISVKNKNNPGQFIDLKSRSLISEQIRMIRSNMQYVFADNEIDTGKTLIVTSSISGEGKSFITVNMAAAFALLDKRVIIVGLDLRKPTIHQYLDADNKEGLSNYLIGQAKEKDIIKATAVENLFIIPSGPVPPNPSELISNNKIEQLIASLRQNFDYIIMDTPPLALVTDTTLLAPLADAAFYIVRHEKTPKIYLKTIADLKTQKLFKSINIIFNAVDYKNSTEYGYGYNKNGYYSDEKKSVWRKLFS
ncbi:Tyrosine-protein kinase wzc [Dyadobacter sp. CECT 9275]|uniref:non-specific protein-tyrosine kinase n=2 Tax=Dyadobacter helix TaxID=2822344 RepID=A0A916JBT3_9BACT|nr:Tyrosine-protein kinase wzc [Dyadobacter sp. CECT 9275]